MKKHENKIKIILNIAIAFMIAVILRNLSFEFRRGYFWGGELGIPILVAFWNLGGKEQAKQIWRDLKGER